MSKKLLLLTSFLSFSLNNLFSVDITDGFSDECLITKYKINSVFGIVEEITAKLQNLSNLPNSNSSIWNPNITPSWDQRITIKPDEAIKLFFNTLIHIPTQLKSQWESEIFSKLQRINKKFKQQRSWRETSDLKISRDIQTQSILFWYMAIAQILDILLQENFLLSTNVFQELKQKVLENNLYPIYPQQNDKSIDEQCLKLFYNNLCEYWFKKNSKKLVDVALLFEFKFSNPNQITPENLIDMLINQNSNSQKVTLKTEIQSDSLRLAINTLHTIIENANNYACTFFCEQNLISNALENNNYSNLEINRFVRSYHYFKNPQANEKPDYYNSYISSDIPEPVNLAHKLTQKREIIINALIKINQNSVQSYQNHQTTTIMQTTFRTVAIPVAIPVAKVAIQQKFREKQRNPNLTALNPKNKSAINTLDKEVYDTEFPSLTSNVEPKIQNLKKDNSRR